MIINKELVEKFGIDLMTTWLNAENDDDLQFLICYTRMLQKLDHGEILYLEEKLGIKIR